MFGLTEGYYTLSHCKGYVTENAGGDLTVSLANSMFWNQSGVHLIALRLAGPITMCLVYPQIYTLDTFDV